MKAASRFASQKVYIFKDYAGNVSIKLLKNYWNCSSWEVLKGICSFQPLGGSRNQVKQIFSQPNLYIDHYFYIVHCTSTLSSISLFLLRRGFFSDTSLSLHSRTSLTLTTRLHPKASVG